MPTAQLYTWHTALAHVRRDWRCVVMPPWEAVARDVYVHVYVCVCVLSVTQSCGRSLPSPYTVVRWTCLQFRRCLVAGTNRVDSTCVLAVAASWSARVYAVARETHGRLCLFFESRHIW